MIDIIIKIQSDILIIIKCVIFGISTFHCCGNIISVSEIFLSPHTEYLYLLISNFPLSPTSNSL